MISAIRLPDETIHEICPYADIPRKNTISGNLKYGYFYTEYGLKNIKGLYDLRFQANLMNNSTQILTEMSIFIEALIYEANSPDVAEGDDTLVNRGFVEGAGEAESGSYDTITVGGAKFHLPASQKKLITTGGYLDVNYYRDVKIRFGLACYTTSSSVSIIETFADLPTTSFQTPIPASFYSIRKIGNL